MITPHVGGCTAESMMKAEIHLAGMLARAIAGRVAVGDTDPETPR